MEVEWRRGGRRFPARTELWAICEELVSSGRALLWWPQLNVLSADSSGRTESKWVLSRPSISVRHWSESFRFSSGHLESGGPWSRKEEVIQWGKIVKRTLQALTENAASLSGSYG